MRFLTTRCSWPSGILRISILLMAFVFGQSLLLAQNPSTAPAKVDAGQIYSKLCAGCHGADAHGTQQGPGLSGSSRLRGRPVSRLRALIRNGIPAAGMPPFDLPDGALDALASLVISLNSSASESGCPWRSSCRKEVFLWQGSMRRLPYGLRRGRADWSRFVECGARADGRPDSTSFAAAQRADCFRL